MSKPADVIIVHETALQSLIRDAGTFALFVGLIGVGKAADSDALQWVGAFVGFIMICSIAAERVGKRRFTVAEARAELDRIERGQK